MQPGEDPRVFGADASRDARRELDEHVRARREKAGVGNDPSGPWGLALSGGGIRSATFCLGLVRGLARNGLLKHFDYLSTVSGGGYLGASLGRLYGGRMDAAQVEEGVASDHSMWLWWLRNNGRYLTPAGARDLGFATASIVRGVISTHLEIGILILAMAALVLLPHFLVSLFPPFHEGTFWNYDLASTMPSVWGWLLLLPLFACAHQVCAYWYTRDRHSATSIVLIGVVVAGCIVVSMKAGRDAVAAVAVVADPATSTPGDQPPVAALLVLAFLVLAPVTAAAAHATEQLRGTSASAQRLLRTKRFSYGLWALAIGVALLLLDWGTWQLTRIFWSGDAGHASTRLGGTILVVAAVGRLVLPELQRLMATSKGPSLNLERLLNITGIALSLLVAVLWTALLSVLVFPQDMRLQYWDPGADPRLAWTTSALPVFVAVALGCLAYILATLKSYDLLNLASLHNYYRARIERAYVSSGNCGPDGRFAGCALDPVSPDRTSSIVPLTDPIAGDDVDLDDYRPHEHGGPIHLVNCCINQSVDDRTGLYNADRKGVAVAVSSLGVELGTNLPDGDTGAAKRAKLSQWIAISGAAASTGMGSNTSTGLAALLFMSGIRLGYWMPSLVRQRAEGAMGRLLAAAPKPVAIVAESLARFPGLSSPVWYVSDGGHFDNTGIHALLKRRAPVIVAADCGADPRYLFADLESLVRKAKIDYCARIEFIKPGGILPEPLGQVLGTPETIQPGLGAQWLVLGRITYDDGTVGALLVVKPRRMDAMPFDMVAYADRNPDFPQQSTGDQFFDEAQWESYHQLGLIMGEAITPQLVADALAIVRSDKPAASSLEEAEKQSAVAALAVAKSDRSKRAGLTVRATLGAGISLSVLVAAWQGFEQYREAKRSAQQLYVAQVLELSEKIQKEPVGMLLEEEFAQVAGGSAQRGDGRYQIVLDRLSARCGSVDDSGRKAQCLNLYEKVKTLVKRRPEPFYDYWFADKRAAYESNRLGTAPEAGTAVVATTAGVAAADAVATARAAGQGGESPRDVMPLPAPAPDFAEVPAAAGTEPPATTGAEPPVLAAPVPPMAEAAPPPTRCAPGVKLFVHVYDAESIPAARELGARLQQALGADSAPIQDVVATALRKGQAAPYVWSQPAVVYPASSSPACIDRIQGIESTLGEGTRIQPINFGNADAIELWIPPRTTIP